MDFDSSQLNRKIAIQSRTVTKDAYGQQSTSWTTISTPFACIRPLSGNELVVAQAVNAEVQVEFRIRYRSSVLAANRIVYAGKYYDIKSVLDESMAHVWLRILCTEGLTLG
jgi:SPP1 family predicted phage head-tail adaptor